MRYRPEKHVWVFNGERRFPSGIFSTVELAEAWIRQHCLSGTLTVYPVDEGCFDWAVREGLTNLKPEKIFAHVADPQFIAGFSTASQEHYHYVNGARKE